MPGAALTTLSSIQCPHGGRALLTTANTHTSAGAGAVTVNGKKVLVKSSIGQCKNDSGAVQGVALIASTQLPVTAK